MLRYTYQCVLRQVVGAREQARREVRALLVDHLDARLARHAGDALDEDLALAVREYAHLANVLGSVDDVVCGPDHITRTLS